MISTLRAGFIYLHKRTKMAATDAMRSETTRWVNGENVLSDSSPHPTGGEEANYAIKLFILVVALIGVSVTNSYMDVQKGI